ncbi:MULTISPECIES: alpha/beta hydrolase [unclassified Bartonella]|uniref:alpha/beta hydrolase n=1 Tax=unclassified Bartonella TaxID=2645622 RepID=UPI0015FD238D|nr:MULTISPECIES: alpha/beta hydrolase [unclassified Bartonella]UXN02875.1 alpha/beta hydrolase [Bartonella sp. HY406]
MKFFVSRFLLLLVFGAVLSACTDERAILWHDKMATASSIAASKAALIQPKKPIAVQPVYVATSRGKENNLYLPFGSKRSPHLNFARVDVGIPAAHQKGAVEANGNKPNSGEHFAAVSMQTYKDRQDFKSALNSALANLPQKNKEILVFIHGYNNNFAESTFRAAQIAYDYQLNAVTVHYAWPSGGALGLYVFDRDSADYARDGLVELLQLVSETNAKQVSVVAHSMGNYVTMEALRTLALKKQRGPINRISNLLLAAPDIDVDVFQMQLKDINGLPKSTAVQVSSNDKALTVSGTITGGHARVGDGSDIAMLNKAGIAVFDMSNVDGGSHAVFASSPTLMALVQDGALSHSVLKGDEDNDDNAAFLADGNSVIKGARSFVQGAASLILYTPARILNVAN